MKFLLLLLGTWAHFGVADYMNSQVMELQAGNWDAHMRSGERYKSAVLNSY